MQTIIVAFYASEHFGGIWTMVWCF